MGLFFTFTLKLSLLFLPKVFVLHYDSNRVWEVVLSIMGLRKGEVKGLP